MDKHNQFLLIFLGGILLQSVCVLGTCISSLSKFNELYKILFGVLLIPNITSYLFIIIGLFGIFNISIFRKNR